MLRPGGVFLYVVPAARHLWELKQVLYERPYPNPEEDIPYEGFDYLEVLPVEETLTIRSREPLLDLFQMTPYRWKTAWSGWRSWRPWTGRPPSESTCFGGNKRRYCILFQDMIDYRERFEVAPPEQEGVWVRNGVPLACGRP